MVKVEGDTAQLFDHRKYDKLIGQDRMCIIGHNRSKTIGDTKHQNAHPFAFDNIVGVHNGTLPYDCRQRFETAGHRYETDSEQLYSHIDKHGIDESIKLMEGAWSLVWYDKRNRTVNFLRNPERPMVYVFSDNHKTLFWASEVAMLYLCLNRFNIPFGAQKESKPFYVAENTLYSFEIPDDRNKPFEKAIRRKMEAPKSFPMPGTWVNRNYHGTNGAFNKGSTNHYTSVHSNPTIRSFDNVAAIREARAAIRSNITAGTSSCTLPPPSMSGLGLKVPTAITDLARLKMSHVTYPNKEGSPYYLGWDGHEQFPRESFEALMGKGCCNCADHPIWGEAVKFLKDGTFVCSTCMLSNKDDVLETVAEYL